MRTQTLVAAVLASGLALPAGPARAEMIGTAQLLAPSADAQRARLDAFVARDDVQRELEAFGVGPADAASRVASLTEAELQELWSRVDSVPAGGHLHTIEILLIILIIVLLI